MKLNYCSKHAKDIVGTECADDKPCVVCIGEKTIWCDCDQIPGCHSTVDCDGEMIVKDPKQWLKENITELIDSLVPGYTDVRIEVVITAYTMSVGYGAND